MLGLPAGVSLGSGGYVRAFAETRFLTRLGSEIAIRIVLARARLLLLPAGHPVEAAVNGALNVTGKNWLRDAESVMEDLGIGTDICHDWSDIGRSSSKKTKDFLKKWKLQVVRPAVWRLEEEWFRVQLSKLNNDGLVPYAELVPLRQPCPAVVRWAPWGKTMWRFHKAWCLARVTGGIPLVIWGGSASPVERIC